MKAAVYYSQNDIRIEDFPIPKIGEDEVLVEMKACGVCGSDLMDWYLRTRAPLVLGHEPVGTIAEKGSQVKAFDVGQKVFVHHHAACLNCYYCRHGEYTLCEQFHKTNIYPGGFSQYFRVPPPNLRTDTLKIPEHLSYEEATMIEPIGCCLRALEKCGIQPGDFVAIIGSGATGIIHAALAKIYGAAKVIVSDLFDFRLAMARKFGADVTVNSNEGDIVKVAKFMTDGRGVDLAIVTAPNAEAYKVGLNVCRKGGKLCVFAPTDPSIRFEISPEQLFFSEVQLVPSYSTSHLETRTALEFVASGRLKVADLVTHRFKLGETAKAIGTALECKESLKIVVLNE